MSIRRKAHDFILSYEDAQEIAEGLMQHRDEEEIGDFIMLLRAITSSDNREDLLAGAEAGVLAYTFAANDGLNRLVLSRLRAARGRR